MKTTLFILLVLLTGYNTYLLKYEQTPFNTEDWLDRACGDMGWNIDFPDGEKKGMWECEGQAATTTSTVIYNKGV